MSPPVTLAEVRYRDWVSPANSAASFPRRYAATQRFTIGVPRAARVTNDGNHVLFLRSPSPDDPAAQLQCLDIASGQVRVLLDPSDAPPAELAPEELARRERAREGGAGVVDYDLVGLRCVAGVGGEVALIDVPTGTVRYLPLADGPFDPRLSPDGEFVTYVSSGDLRLHHLASGQDELWASDVDPLVTWATADFVSAEEIGRSRGYWWSPDNNGVLATRVSLHDVREWWIADPADPASSPRPIRYPAAGTTNASTELWWLPLPGTGAKQRMDWSEGGRWEYLLDVVWTGQPNPLICRQTRDQTQVQHVLFDVVGATAPEVRREIIDDAWVEPFAGVPVFLGSQIFTIERIGDRYCLCADGEPLDPELDVVSLVGFKDDRPVVRARTTPTTIDVLWAGPQGGWQVLAEGGVATASTAADVVVTSQAAGDKVETITLVNAPGREPLEIDDLSARPEVEPHPLFLRLGTDELSSMLFVPRDHDGSQPLPVLLDPYGGPHGQRVIESARAHLVSQWFADQGFAVLVIDGRGTPGKGAAWERTVKGDLATGVLADQINGLHAAAEEFPFLDLGRVGIRGWSFGGYLAALAAMERPADIHCAIAGAPVTDWALYDTHYTERYLGQPTIDVENYHRSSLLHRAGQLERPLMLIHGFADDNVVAAHTLQLSGALLAAGRPHEVLPLARVSHMTPQLDVAENLLILQAAFLHRHLGSTQ